MRAHRTPLGGPERPAAVAGRFYPADRATLERAVEAALAAARAPHGPRPIALAAPHAGYEWCGRVLGEAWARARGHAFDAAVVLGTNHAAPWLARAAVWPVGAWRTPLGPVEVDEGLAEALLAAAGADVTSDAAAHREEHSIEVQLPFAQRAVPGVPVLPVLVGIEGAAACARFGRALAAALEGRRALIVASTDLSHFPARADAERVDHATLEAAASLDLERLGRALGEPIAEGVRGLVTCACGESPLRVAIAAARALGATRGTVLAYAHSAAAGGDPSRVVGYGALAFD